jgi:hypothetical protein
MKRIIITLCLSLCCVMAFAQSFTGTVVYSNTYKSKLPQVTDAQFADMMGTVQTWYTNGTTYRQDLNGQLLQWQLYVPAENKLYTKMANSTDAIWNDAAENKDEVLSSEINRGVVEILGYKCDELVLHCKSGVQKYYFTTKLPLDAGAYAKHEFGNWREYLSKAPGVALKVIVDSPQFTMESVATEVKPGTPDKALFVLPAGIGTVKSPY